jgi:flavin reductase
MDPIADAFKQGMRRLAATICVVTTAEGETWYGMTATAVCSVGIDPPSLLVSVAKSASLHDPTVRTRRFCVNVLSTRHGDLVATFSGKLTGMARFTTGGWQIDAQGLPFLPDAQACFFCAVDQAIAHASHGIFIARVLDARFDERVAPLLYEDGKLAASVPL